MRKRQADRSSSKGRQQPSGQHNTRPADGNRAGEPLAGEALVRGRLDVIQPDDVRDLQRSVGNHAVGRALADPVGDRRRPVTGRSAKDPAADRPAETVVQRRPSRAPKVDPEVKARMLAAEGRLDALSARCSANATRLGAASDRAIDSVVAASAHLRESSRFYSEGFGRFMGVMHKADATYEADKEFTDMVQGVLVAAALTVIGPEALAASLALKLATRVVGTDVVAQIFLDVGVAAVKKVADLNTAKFVGGAISEGLETKVGAAVDVARTGILGDTGKPSDTAAAAGPNAGDRYTEAFTFLDRMIADLPRVGSLTAAQGELARAAEKVTRETVKLRTGEPARWTAEEIEVLVARIDGLRGEGVKAAEQAETLANRVTAIKGEVISKPIEAPGQVEDRLWTAWMASLKGGQRELLNNEDIYAHLGPAGKNLFDFGSITTDWDLETAVHAAQSKWLQDNGITPGRHPTTQYMAEMKLRELRPALIGQKGVIADTNTVSVNGETWPRSTIYGGDGRRGAGVNVIDVTVDYDVKAGDVILAEILPHQIHLVCLQEFEEKVKETAPPETVPSAGPTPVDTGTSLADQWAVG
jgi:hypothetical protein